MEEECLQEKFSKHPISFPKYAKWVARHGTTKNEITGRTTSKSGRLRWNTSVERCKEWIDYFSALLGSPPIANNPDEEIELIVEITLPSETAPFTNEEFQKTLQKMSNGKAAGLDEIPAAVWKTGSFNNIL